MKKSITRKAMLVAIVFLFAWNVAGAYSITSGAPSQPAGFDGLFLPFQNFINSINSVGTSDIMGTGVPLPSSNGFLTTSAHNAFLQFDNWLYGIFGFHIANLLTDILSVFSWLLGWVKGAVDWLLGLIQ